MNVKRELPYRLPSMGQKFADEASFVHRQAPQHVLQIRMRVEPVELGRLRSNIANGEHGQSFCGAAGGAAVPIRPYSMGTLM